MSTPKACWCSHRKFGNRKQSANVLGRDAWDWCQHWRGGTIRLMGIEGLKKYRGRNPQGYFADLPWDVRQRARRWLWKLCEPWGRNLPTWRFAILVGQAKRLALNPPTSAWGRSMLAKRGGYAVQKEYRLENRQPTAKATHVRVWKAKARKQAEQEAAQRAKLGIPPKARVAYLPLG